MRVALCFFGLPRAMEISYILQKWYFIDPLNCDVFIHTWNINHAGYRFKRNTETYIIKYEDSPPPHQKTEDPADPCYTMTNEDFIKDVIKPKKYIIDDYQLFTTKYGDGSAAAMYYSIQQSNNLKKEFEKENMFEYDMVLISRFDLIPRRSLNQNEIESSKNCIFTNVNRDIDAMPPWPVRKSDMFIFGNNRDMNIYADSFETWKINRHLIGEHVFQKHCFDNRINFLQGEFPILLLHKYTPNEFYANYLGKLS